MPVYVCRGVVYTYVCVLGCSVHLCMCVRV